MPAGISIAEGEFHASAESISRIRTSGFISLLCAPEGAQSLRAEAGEERVDKAAHFFRLLCSYAHKCLARGGV